MPIHLVIQGLDQFENDLTLAKADIEPQIKQAMVKSTNVVQQEAQRRAPYKTGTLRRSILPSVSSNGLVGTVLQDSSIAKYGIMIEYGTKAHAINPVNKQALFWNGALNPYRRVMHPGFAAKPFMFPALEAKVDDIQRYFSEAINNIVLKAAGKI